MSACAEATFLANLDAHNTHGVLLSWSSLDDTVGGGNGHVNPKSQAYVVQRMAELGYTLNEQGTRRMRNAARSMRWLSHTVMRFDRREPRETCARRASINFKAVEFAPMLSAEI